MVLTRFILLAALSGVFAGLGGCATAPANSGYANFSGYADAVFRRQNNLNSRLMMLNEADQLPDCEEFDKTQKAFMEACELLNEYAEKESSGETVSLGFKVKVQNSVDACDAKIKQMELLLQKLGVGK